MRPLAAILLGLFALACAPCGGAHPALDSCTLGVGFAECNGMQSGDSVIACTIYGDCRWFTGGCIADGYTATACPSGENSLSCCGGHRPSPAVIDRFSNRNVTVTIGTTSADVRPSVTCAGTAPSPVSGLCDTRPTHRLRAGQGLHGIFWASATDADTLYGYSFTVEVMRDDDGSLHARVCNVPWTDVGPTSCPATDGHACATNGTLTLSTFPTDPASATSVTLDVHADFGSYAVDLHL